MARMKDVADRAGVSVATVSNVLTGKRAVTPEVRENVLRAIKELDYHVNMIARGLKTQRTNTIGVVLPDVTKLFFNDVLHGMMTAASDFGYCITLLSSNYNFDTERQSIAALRGNHVDAVILDSCVNCRDVEQWGAELADSLAQSVPIVSLETTLHKERISSIRVDCKRGSGQMTQHLIDQNRRRILYISGPSQLMHEIERLEGYILQCQAQQNDTPAARCGRLAVAYINEHYADCDLKLPDVLEHLGVSRSYFSTVFKEKTGQSFVEYLTNLRMEKAKEYLRETGLCTYEIADRIGFADPHYFSLTFRRRTGMTPRQYREAESGT